MPEIKNTFLKSRMNKDTEARILPRNEYRDAQNANVSASEDASVGSLENVRGNKLLTNLGLTDYNIEIIGQYADTVNNRIFFFLTNFTDASADSLGNLSRPSATAGGSVGSGYTNFVRTGANNYIAYCQLPNVADSSAIDQSNIKFDILVSGTFLNFSKTHPISGINIIENLLFFTDNRNQPRKINVENAITNPLTYYTNEDHISVAKYAPYEAISFLKNTTGTLESTLLNEFDEWLPAFWGAPGAFVTNVGTQDFLIFNENTASNPSNESYSTIANYLGSGSARPYPIKVAVSNDPNGSIAYVQSIDVTTSPAKVFLKSNKTGSNTPIVNITDLGWTNNSVFLFSIENPDYNSNFAGDKKLLEDKFVRFSYRFKYDDNEYSLTAPFTQHAFVPKQYGYFLEGDDEKTKASSIVEFMENQITTVGLVVNLPYKSNELADKLKVSEIQLLYKASDDLNVKVIADVDITDISGGVTAASIQDAGLGYVTSLNVPTSGGSGSGLTVDISVSAEDGSIVSIVVNSVGEGYLVGDLITVVYNNATVDAKLLISSLNSTYIYNYSSEKPIKVLTDEEVTRVSDIVPMRAKTQEVVGNRVVYGNFLQNNATPLNLDYKLETVTKGELTNSSTNKEFLNNTLKQNRSYQVGVVLQDRYGRASNVIINQLDLITKNSTIFNSYTNGGINPLSWPGESLKVIFNSQIPSELPSSLPYNGLWKEGENPLGWYTYKIVVQQQEQDYYNVYVPGALSGNIIYTKNDVKLAYSNTSSVASIALFNDNINKIPRDLKEVGPTDNIYGSSVVLYNRVKQNKIQNVGTSTNITIGQQNLSPIKQEVTTVRPFSELGEWTGFKNINLHYLPGTSTSHFQYDNPTFIYPGAEGEKDPFFLRNNKNPLIATINTQKRMGFTSTNQEDSTYLFADKLMVFETEPFKSNIDIYYETSTTGIISELNNSILSDGSGTTDAPFGLSSININNWFESTAIGQSISNTFEVVNSSGASQGGATALSTTVVIKEITNSGTGSATSRPTVVSRSDWPISIEQVTAPVSPNIGPTFRFTAARRYPFLNGSDTSRRYDVTLEISTDTYPSVNVNIRAVQLNNVTPILYRMSPPWELDTGGDPDYKRTEVKSLTLTELLASTSSSLIPSTVLNNTGTSYDEKINAVFYSQDYIKDEEERFKDNYVVWKGFPVARFSFITNGFDPITTFNSASDTANNLSSQRIQGLTYEIKNVAKFSGYIKEEVNPNSNSSLNFANFYERGSLGGVDQPFKSEFSIETYTSGQFSWPQLYWRENTNLATNFGSREQGFRACQIYNIEISVRDASSGVGNLPSNNYSFNFIITKNNYVSIVNQ
jgi:hypothetical protein